MPIFSWNSKIYAMKWIFFLDFFLKWIQNQGRNQYYLIWKSWYAFFGYWKNNKLTGKSLLTLTNFPAHNLEDINLHPLPEENQFLLQINAVAIIILIINTTITIMEMAIWLFTDTITMSSICQLLYGQNQQVRKLKIRSSNHKYFDTVKRQEFIK